MVVVVLVLVQVLLQELVWLASSLTRIFSDQLVLAASLDLHVRLLCPIMEFPARTSQQWLLRQRTCVGVNDDEQYRDSDGSHR